MRRRQQKRVSTECGKGSNEKPGIGKCRLRTMRTSLFLVTWFYLLLCYGFHCVLGGKGDLVANWDTFQVLSKADVTQSLEFLQTLPLFQYWDTLKGRYRIGTIGQLLRVLYPEQKHLITRIEKQVNHANKVHAVEHYAVDYSQIFMHMLVLVGHLDDVSKEVSDVLDRFERKQRSDGLWNVSITDDLSFEDLAAQESILAYKREALSIEEEIMTIRHELALKTLQMRREHKVAGRQSLHRNLTLALESTKDVSIRLLIDHYLERQDLVRQLYEEEDATHRAIVSQEHAAALQDLEQQHHFHLNILKYRAQQELEYLSRKEDSYRMVMDRKMDLLRKGTEEIVGVLFEELLALFMATFGTFESSVSVIRNIFLAIVLVVSVTEISKSLRLLLRNAFLRQKRLQSHRSNETGISLFSISSWLCPPSSDEIIEILSHRSQSKDLVYSSILWTQLQQLTPQLLLACNQQTALFPNVLFYGLPGCGKTITAELLVETVASRSKCKYIVLCGADILSLHADASLYLRNLFATTQKTILVIDEADLLIRSRGEGLVSNILYAFLEGLKTSNPHIGVIFTTRLSIPEIDPAILNR